MHSGTHLQIPETHFRPVAVQLTQEDPPTPQAVLLPPARQCPAVSQQPVQVFAAHVPPHPSLSPVHLFAQLGTQAHAPALQVGVGLAQATQLAPPTPQAEELVPVLQRPCWQQPPQLFVGHGAPQPSSSPWHLPVQLGVQTPWQVWLSQVCPLSEQSRQSLPPLPQALSVPPGKQRSS